MQIDYRIKDGPSGGLTFEFIACMHAFVGVDDYDRRGPDVFHVREEAFLFIEGMVAEVYPDWMNYGHWGTVWLSRAEWFDVLSRFARLRFDLKGNARLDVIVRKYIMSPGLLPNRHRLHRRALIRFLDEFEGRVRAVLQQYPYLVICGV